MRILSFCRISERVRKNIFGAVIARIDLRYLRQAITVSPRGLVYCPQQNDLALGMNMETTDHDLHLMMVHPYSDLGGLWEDRDLLPGDLGIRNRNLLIRFADGETVTFNAIRENFENINLKANDRDLSSSIYFLFNSNDTTKYPPFQDDGSGMTERYVGGLTQEIVNADGKGFVLQMRPEVKGQDYYRLRVLPWGEVEQIVHITDQFTEKVENEVGRRKSRPYRRSKPSYETLPTEYQRKHVTRYHKNGYSWTFSNVEKKLPEAQVLVLPDYTADRTDDDTNEASEGRYIDYPKQSQPSTYYDRNAGEYTIIKSTTDDNTPGRIPKRPGERTRFSLKNQIFSVIKSVWQDIDQGGYVFKQAGIEIDDGIPNSKKTESYENKGFIHFWKRRFKGKPEDTDFLVAEQYISDFDIRLEKRDLEDVPQHQDFLHSQLVIADSSSKYAHSDGSTLRNHKWAFEPVQKIMVPRLQTDITDTGLYLVKYAWVDNPIRALPHAEFKIVDGNNNGSDAGRIQTIKSKFYNSIKGMQERTKVTITNGGYYLIKSAWYGAIQATLKRIEMTITDTRWKLESFSHANSKAYKRGIIQVNNGTTTIIERHAQVDGPTLRTRIELNENDVQIAKIDAAGKTKTKITVAESNIILNADHDGGPATITINTDGSISIIGTKDIRVKSDTLIKLVAPRIEMGA